MKNIIEKRILFFLIPVTAFILIFSTAALCNMCTLNHADSNFDTIPEEVINALAQEEELSSNTSESIVPDEEQLTIQEEEEKSSTKSQDNVENTDEDSGQKYLEDKHENTVPGVKKIILRDKRIVISLDSMADRGTDWSYQNGNDPNYYESKDYFVRIGIPEEQLLFFWGQDEFGGTFDNFKFAVDTLKVSTDENCIVYVFLMSHGNEGNPETGLQAGMEFANGEGNEHWGEVMTYSEICSMLNEIKCEKMAVVTHSCASSDSVAPLTENALYPRVSMAPITIQEILNYIMTDSSSVDMNIDGMISLLDVYNFVKDPEMTSNPARYEGVKLSDYSGISSNIFLN